MCCNYYSHWSFTDTFSPPTKRCMAVRTGVGHIIDMKNVMGILASNNEIALMALARLGLHSLFFRKKQQQHISFPYFPVLMFHCSSEANYFHWLQRLGLVSGFSNLVHCTGFNETKLWLTCERGFGLGIWWITSAEIVVSFSAVFTLSITNVSDLIHLNNDMCLNAPDISSLYSAQW